MDPYHLSKGRSQNIAIHEILLVFAKILPTCFRRAGVEPGFTRVKTDNFSIPQNNMAMLSYVRFNHDLNINL